MTAVKRILSYLSKTIDYGIEYTKSDGKLEGFYSDANWAGDHADRRSTSGYVFQLANGAITWASRKQNSVALSTCEAEYMALSVTTQEVIWLRRLLEEMRKWPEGAHYNVGRQPGSYKYSEESRLPQQNKPYPN